jgi:hypothetical protein
VAENIPAASRGTAAEERYSDVLAARDQAQISQSLGDESALDLLAMRDHVLGLEAELTNARAEAAHARRVADALREELRQTTAARVLRALRMVRRYQVGYAERRAAARIPR